MNKESGEVDTRKLFNKRELKDKKKKAKLEAQAKLKEQEGMGEEVKKDD